MTTLWTPEALEMTPWAIAFNKTCPTSYRAALTYALRPGLRVELVPTSAELDDGAPWALSVYDESEPFWMERVATKTAGAELCREMGWRLIR